MIDPRPAGQRGGIVELVVEDDGPGIAPSVREGLFQPFVTTKARGTGLGLALCRKIVREHGGTITAADSALGGARFVVELPPAEKRESTRRLEAPGA